MYEITLLNEKGEKFRKIYKTEYLFRKDLQKFKNSKRLTIVSVIKL